MAGDTKLLSAWVNVDSDGQLKLSPDMLAALEIAPGDRVNMQVESGVLKVRSKRAAIETARKIVAQRMPEGVSLADELIADRRREEAKENPRHRDDAAE
jgi:hypothetical protein